MTIQNMPASLQAAIQQGFLEKEFQDALSSSLGFRSVADKEEVAINVGETVTKTRLGYKAPVTTPLTPSANTNLDNGLTPSSQAIEQYTLGLNMYADTIDLNIVTSQVGIANLFLKNAQTNGMQARQSLDRLARNSLYNSYNGGRTRVRTTLGAPAAVIAVDDVRGFLLGMYNSTMQPVSSTNTEQVIVGSNVYTLIGAAADVTNVSTTALGTSGTLTFSSNVSIPDGTALIRVAHVNAPVLIRPNGKWEGGSAISSTTSTNSLAAADILTLGVIEDAIAALKNNTGVQNEMFNLYLDNVSMRQLFADDDFKKMYYGQFGSEAAKTGQIFSMIGANFIPTTEAITQAHPSVAGLVVHRPIVVAQGALVEGDFAGMTQKAADFGGQNSEINMVEGVAQVTRGPIDRLSQIVSQSWFWIGGFAAPTDVTTTSAIIPTAGQQYFKRAVMIEHV